MISIDSHLHTPPRSVVTRTRIQDVQGEPKDRIEYEVKEPPGHKQAHHLKCGIAHEPREAFGDAFGHDHGDSCASVKRWNRQQIERTQQKIFKYGAFYTSVNGLL